MTALLVHRAGLALVQDAGRPGQAAIGVGRSGAADRASYDLANRLVGNSSGAAALEVTLGGLEVEAADGAVWLAVTGAPVPLLLDGRPEPTGAVLALRRGARLTLGQPANGLRSYVAVRGGVDVPPVLGSRARDTLAGLGPAPLAAGDVLPVGSRIADDMRVDAVPSQRYDDRPVLRVVRGPRDDWVRDPDRLTTITWTVAPDSDRVGVRLTGGRLDLADAARQLPSEGAVRGAIQVPPDGGPVVFGPDHPVTGGYPVVAVVVDADTDRLAQLRPGEQVGSRARQGIPGPRVLVALGSRLDELDQHPARVLGVDEVDPAVRRAALGVVVQQPESALAEGGADARRCQRRGRRAAAGRGRCGRGTCRSWSPARAVRAAGCRSRCHRPGPSPRGRPAPRSSPRARRSCRRCRCRTPSPRRGRAPRCRRGRWR